MRHTLLPFALAATCAVAFLLMGQAPSPHASMDLYSRAVAGGGGGGLTEPAADLLYLRLDASNDPVTGEVIFGSPTGTNLTIDGPTAFLWSSILDSDVSGAYAAIGTTAWDGTTWDAGAILSTYGEGYPGNGYCTSVAEAPGSAEIWINGDPTSRSRMCGPVLTGMELGVSNGNGSTFENVLALTTLGAIVNEDGASDLDFRVEGDTDANVFVVDASTNRVGLGTATPAVRLDVQGQASVDSATAAAPGYSFEGDLDTGFYRSATDSISWSVGGAESGVFRPGEANFYTPASFDYGTAADPSIRWSAATTTGLYGSATTVSVTSGGVRAATVGPGTAALYDTDGTTVLLGTDSSRAVARGVVPTATALYSLGANTLRWLEVDVADGSASDVSVSVGANDAGLYRNSAQDRVLLANNDGDVTVQALGTGALGDLYCVGQTSLALESTDGPMTMTAGTSIVISPTTSLTLGGTMIDLDPTAVTTLSGTDCNSDSEVGSVFQYSKGGGATISTCICTKVASVYAYAVVGAGDCT